MKRRNSGKRIAIVTLAFLLIGGLVAVTYGLIYDNSVIFKTGAKVVIGLIIGAVVVNLRKSNHSETTTNRWTVTP